MLEAFKEYILKEKIFKSDENILIAVSGGVDSVVLCHLFQQAKFNFGIAHCNFQLRGRDSDEDALFVENLAQQMKVPFYKINFDTTTYVEKNKVSIQVAARELRYKWLEKIRAENNFNFIATAHHLDDSLETILYNFTKGCGIRGIHGILSKVNFIIRPLLFTYKKEVLNFAQQHKIQFREDVSNFSDKYSRNKIRLQVIPTLEKINPSLQKTTAKNIQRFKETELLFNYAVVLLQKEITFEKNNQLWIHLKKLVSSPAPQTLLFEILRPFGFNNDQVEQMLNSIGHQAGAVFSSPSHRVLLDRDYFVVKKMESMLYDRILIDDKVTNISFPNGKLSFEKIKNEDDLDFSDQRVGYFNFSKISFPLTMRKWEAGDFFQPFGMHGKGKKVKKFLTDLKLNRFDKDKVWVLESGGEICWVIGLRMDERFRVLGDTEVVFKIEWLPV